MIVDPDDSVDGNGWPKRTWDIWHLKPDGERKLLDTLPELLRYLQVMDDSFEIQLAEVRWFMRLPAYRAAPPKLKQQIETWLVTQET